MADFFVPSCRDRVAAGTILAIDLAQRRTDRQAPFLSLGWLQRGVLYGGLVIFTLGMGGLSAQAPFIYFQF